MTRIAPDAVWSYEAGGKLALDGGRTLVSGALYRIDWQRIEQPIFLPSCAFYMQGNAGAARIEGGELELQGAPARAWRVRAGLGYTRALITAEGNTGQHVGDPVYQVPRLTLSTGVIWSTPVGAGWMGFVAGDASYTGSSVSANSGADLQLVRAPYRLVNLRLGLRSAMSEVALNVRNAGDARPNLGDIGYLGYQRFVPGTTTPMPQVATLAPRTITLRYVRHW
jgi:outer membrane receptor protein involved in Fe transport